METNNFIPKISNAILHELAGRIKPVVSFMKDGVPTRYYIKEVSLSSVAYTWDPVKTEVAEEFVVLGQIITYHTYGYYGFFKPSIAEVLSQIPEKYLGIVTAFEIVAQPQSADDLNEHVAILNAGYHVAITQLYGKKGVHHESIKGRDIATITVEENSNVLLLQ